MYVAKIIHFKVMIISNLIIMKEGGLILSLITWSHLIAIMMI